MGDAASLALQRAPIEAAIGLVFFFLALCCLFGIVEGILRLCRWLFAPTLPTKGVSRWWNTSD
jgi:hypothetical protein